MKVLDAGAYGVICPMVNTREDAERLVAATHYPPLGTRSFGGHPHRHPEAALARIQKGFQFVTVSSDARLIARRCAAGARSDAGAACAEESAALGLLDPFQAWPCSAIRYRSRRINLRSTPHS
jgi:2-keto-3-deoxy-L-rhamnonate aldolase RhmA